ncbi:hypothetical protein [Edaphobacter bradus]|uniref:hypothetical protein n=1 Tax=Edaphobacter bradus TaxID=2259016 RepID=UPI0021E0BAFA|nr:hypothetical protein [Edaphobacter bradus]
MATSFHANLKCLALSSKSTESAKGFPFLHSQKQNEPLLAAGEKPVRLLQQVGGTGDEERHRVVDPT